jgi:O-antigen/teichoic acid export membrane protein
MMAAVACQAAFSLPTLLVLLFTDDLLILITVFWTSQAIAGFLVYRYAQSYVVHDVSLQNAEPDILSERFGFHLTAMAALRIVSSNIDRIFVWILVGPAAVAVYTIALLPFSKLEQLIPIETLALPLLSTREISASMKAKLLRHTLLGVVILIPIIAVGLLVAPFAYAVLFPEFKESVALFQLVCTSLIFAPFAFLRAGLTAWQRQRELYVIELVSPAAKIALFAIFGILFGVVGIVISFICAKAIESFLILGLFLRLKE